jgi:hypothetical protein
VILNGLLDAVALGNSLRVVRAPRPMEYPDYEPTGLAEAG